MARRLGCVRTSSRPSGCCTVSSTRSKSTSRPSNTQSTKTSLSNSSQLKSTQVRSKSVVASDRLTDSQQTSLQTKQVTAAASVRPSGQCPCCLRTLSLTTAGVLHKHGPHCPGAGQPPCSTTVITQQQKQPGLLSAEVSQIPTIHDETASLSTSVLSSRAKLLKYIPKASRMLAADKLSNTLQSVIDKPDDIKTWKQLLRFGNCCLKVPGDRGGKRHRSSLASKVNHSLANFESNDGSQQITQPPSKIFNRRSEDLKLAARVSAKIEEGDIRGAVRLAVSDDTLAPNNDATVAELQQLHPPRAVITSVQPPSIDDAVPLVLTSQDITEAVRSFPVGSAGGVDGLRPQHLKDMISTFTGAAGQRLVDCLVDFANLCLSKDLSAEVRSVFFGASLCALNKKAGGVRPIAVGCTLRRLVAKAVCRRVKQKVVEMLSPIQLGFGIELGAEAAVHAATKYLEVLGRGQGLLKLDFSNAFNSISRDILLHVVASDLPELFKFVKNCYAEQSNLYFGSHIILSAEGVQQGDPLGPLLYCLCTLPLVKKLKSELNVWFMDDGTLGGNVNQLLDDFSLIMKESCELGLHVNVFKCELITNDTEVVRRFRALAPEITVVKPSAATLLGAPISIGENIDLLLSNKLQDFQRFMSRLKSLDSHDALFLLKNCLSIPKLAYTLRCSPCYSSQLLQRYDDVMRSSLQSIMNVILTDVAWDQATLPVAYGGIGVRKATDISLPAYIASMAGSHMLIHRLLPARLHDSSGTYDKTFMSALSLWTDKAGVSQIPVAPFSGRQKVWDSALVSVIRETVVSCTISGGQSASHCGSSSSLWCVP